MLGVEGRESGREWGDLRGGGRREALGLWLSGAGVTWGAWSEMRGAEACTGGTSSIQLEYYYRRTRGKGPTAGGSLELDRYYLYQ